MDNEVIKAIRERRSIRRFKPEQINDEELKTVLEAGTWAASGKGKQDPWIVAVQNKETCDMLRKMNAKLMGTEADPYYGATQQYVSVFWHQPEWWKQRKKDGKFSYRANDDALRAASLYRCLS